MLALAAALLLVSTPAPADASAQDQGASWVESVQADDVADGLRPPCDPSPGFDRGRTNPDERSAGPAARTWDPSGDFGRRFGRLGTSAAQVLTLTQYYRYCALSWIEQP